MIWATRGKSWGFKFLMDGGYEDPLPVYEEVFEQHLQEPQYWCFTSGRSALRFPDPLNRKDAAGRLILHDFVILESDLDAHSTYEDARERVWSQVAETYEELWDR